MKLLGYTCNTEEFEAISSDDIRTNNINRLSVTGDYDLILAKLLVWSRNGRIDVIRFSVPTTSGTVSVIQRDAKRNTSGLTAPGSLTTCPMCEGQRWLFNVLTILLLWYTEPPSLGHDLKDPAILGLKACWRLFVNLTQIGLDLPTAWLTVQASSNCATLTNIFEMVTSKNVFSYELPYLCDIFFMLYLPSNHL